MQMNISKHQTMPLSALPAIIIRDVDKERVLHNGARMEVPASALTKSKENPTNGALLWVWNGKVQCFKPGTFY
jgi:hypothetical protein